MEITILGLHFNIINILLYIMLINVIFTWIKSLFKPYGKSDWYYVSESYEKKSRNKKLKNEYKRRFMNEDSSIRRSSSI